MDVLLGIDIGTGSTKGVLTDTAGTVLAVESLSHSMELPRPGWAEFDAEAVWWHEVCAISRALLDRMPEHGALAGVCVSGLGPCLVLCDDDLRPVRPAILYGIDSRAVAEIDSLTAQFGEQQILERGGSLLTSQAVGPKLQWVRNHEPDVFADATMWFSSNSYIVAKLTGEYTMDHHTASQCDPLYATPTFEWNHQWAQQICRHLPLPRLAWPAEVVGSVTATAAAMSGIPAGTPVVAGTVDAYAEAFSVGVRKPGDLMLMYGSTMFMVQIVADFHWDRTLWTTAAVERDSYALAAGTATAGSLITWLQSVTGGASLEELTAEALAVPPGCEGLLMLPYFSGERTPIFDPHARGVLAGLTLRHGRGHLLRAAYEGIAFGVRDVLTRFEDASPSTRLVAVGGGLDSPVWPQAISDITGRTQLTPEQTIGAAFGDALLAAIGVGLVPPDTDWTRMAGRIEPNPKHAARYADLYRTWRELYLATKTQVHRLAAMDPL
ncbi:FGGY-family carbohydrate kinase [Mycolicibacterium sp. XJ662]